MWIAVTIAIGNCFVFFLAIEHDWLCTVDSSVVLHRVTVFIQMVGSCPCWSLIPVCHLLVVHIVVQLVTSAFLCPQEFIPIVGFLWVIHLVLVGPSVISLPSSVPLVHPGIPSVPPSNGR